VVSIAGMQGEGFFIINQRFMGVVAVC